MKIADFRYVLLDLDNTLYPYAPAHVAAQAELSEFLASRLSVPLERVQVALKAGRKDTNLRLACTAASHHRLLYIQMALESLGVNPMEWAPEAHEVYWGCYLENMLLFPEAMGFLSSLRPERTCLVTDLVSDIQYRKVRRLGLHRFVHHIVTSEEAGIEKPAPAMFLRAMEKLGASPSECCMVGDNFAKDAVGAAALGIHAFWLRDGLPIPSDLNSNLITPIETLRDCHD